MNLLCILNKSNSVTNLHAKGMNARDVKKRRNMAGKGTKLLLLLLVSLGTCSYILLSTIYRKDYYKATRPALTLPKINIRSALTNALANWIKYLPETPSDVHQINESRPNTTRTNSFTNDTVLMTTVIKVNNVTGDNPLIITYYDYFAKFFELDPVRDARDPLFNDHKFEFSLNANTCRGDEYMVAVVHSATRNFEQRNRIRNTWGSVRRSNTIVVRRPIFLLGKIYPPDTVLQANINRESALFEDIVQGNFVDSYRNLTYKNIMGLHWLRSFCNKTKFVLKTDDDTLVNIVKLTEFLHTANAPSENFLYCVHFRRITPIRGHSKFSLSRDDYSLEKFPPYCRGWFYVMSNDVVNKLYTASKTVRFFWIDDVLVTGALTSKAGISIRHCPFATTMPKPTAQTVRRNLFYLGFPKESVKHWNSTWEMITSNFHNNSDTINVLQSKTSMSSVTLNATVPQPRQVNNAP